MEPLKDPRYMLLVPFYYRFTVGFLDALVAAAEVAHIPNFDFAKNYTW